MDNVLPLIPLLAALSLAGLAALLLVILHKVRKVHLAIYGLLDNAAATRREAEALFAQIQALLALERKLGLPDALPPMRGWAGSPDFLLALAERVFADKPETVMECSSGVSTLVIARCLQLKGAGHVYSLEHDPEFGERTRTLLNKHGLADWATVLDAPLQTRHTATPWYAEEAIPAGLPPIDMLVVDGPPTAVAPLARFPALPRLMPRLAKKPVVIVDDADRGDEARMVKLWALSYPHLQIVDLHCEKGCVVLQGAAPTPAAA